MCDSSERTGELLSVFSFHAISPLKSRSYIYKCNHVCILICVEVVSRAPGVAVVCGGKQHNPPRSTVVCVAFRGEYKLSAASAHLLTWSACIANFPESFRFDKERKCTKQRPLALKD